MSGRIIKQQAKHMKKYISLRNKEIILLVILGLYSAAAVINFF